MFRLKRFGISTSIIFFLVLTIFSQTSRLPTLKKGESYAKVRLKMLKAGWKPYHSPEADECYKGDERCQGRPEMQNCAGTGLAPCRFLWKSKRKTIVIFTSGENSIYNGYEIEK